MAIRCTLNPVRKFKNLKKEVLFSKDNAKSLNMVSYSCFIISALYLGMSIYIFSIIKNYIFAFSTMLAIIFAVSGVGIKILNEIYKKAIECKEENDFTI